MSALDWPAVEDAAEQGDNNAVLGALNDIDETVRATWLPDAEKLRARLQLTREESHTRPHPEGRLAQDQAACLAVFCCGPPDGRTWGPGWRFEPKVIEAAILQRSREWRQQWAQTSYHWPVLRRLVRAGACDRPPDVYVRAMVHAFARQTADELYESLLADPDLLIDDVFLIFAIDSLGWRGGGPGAPPWESWSAALLRLEAEGRITRSRLLDESLAGVQRDFLMRAIQEFAVFHNKLRPSIDEIAERQDVYLRLLESAAHPAVGLAIRQLSRLQRADRLDGRAVLDRAPPATMMPTAPVAKRAVGLVGQILDSNPGLVVDGLPAILAALGHQHADVQEAVIAVAERHQRALDPAARTQITGMLALVDPALRERAEKLCGRTSPTVQSQGPRAIPVPGPITTDTRAVPRLLEEARVKPVEDLDELLALTAIVLERQDDPDELERWCAGVAQLCGRPIDDRRARPLLKRARWLVAGRNAPWGGLESARELVSIVTHYLLTRERMWTKLDVREGPHASWVQLSGGARLRRIHCCRARVLIHRCEHNSPGQLLSAPTHRGGWIDPMALVARLRLPVRTYDFDLAQALLRLAPDNAAAAADALTHLPGEAALAARAALDPTVTPPTDQTFPAAWDAVTQLRNWTTDAPPYSPVSAEGRLTDQDQPSSPLALPAPDGAFVGDFNVRRWLALVWPGNREPYYASALRMNQARRPTAPRAQQETIGLALDPMLDPDEPLGPHALALLATALGGNSEDRLRAAEVVNNAIATRRLDSRRLGRAIATAMQTSRHGPDRWADGLQDVALIGPLHAHELQIVLESTLAELQGVQLKLHRFVDLLRRVAQDANARIDNQQARDWLTATPPRSRIATHAQTALAVTGDGAQRSIAAAQLAKTAASQQRARWQPQPPIPSSRQRMGTQSR